MKFDDITKDDTVYIKVKVKVGWRRSVSFWVPKKVDKVTPKHFVVGSKRYKTEDGQCIGGNYGERAAFLGDNDGGAKVTNQLADALAVSMVKEQLFLVK